MSNKQTVKSCGCRQCKRGKGNSNGQFIMKYEERAARHQNKIILKRGFGEVVAAHAGTYTD